MKPAPKTRRRYTQLTVKELSGVDLPAQEGAKVGFTKRNRLATLVEVGKRMTLTSAEAGHSHGVCGYDNADYQGGETDGAYLNAGGDYGGSGYHRHPWVRTAAGAYVIGMALGHTHEMLDDASLDEAAGMDAETPADVASEAVKAAPKPAPVPAAKAAPTPTPTPAPKETAMAMTTDEIARLERAEALATMTDAQKRHHARLDAPARVTFEKMAPAERAAVVDADKVVFVAKHGHLAGRAFRASDEAANPDFVAMARTVDDEAEKRIAAEKRATRTEVLKRAELELGGFGGTADERADLLEAVAAGAEVIGLPVEKRARLTEIIKGASAAAVLMHKQNGTPVGGTGSTDESPLGIFQAELVKFAKAKGVAPALATVDFLNTPEGGELYAAAYPPPSITA